MADTKIINMEGGELGSSPAGTEVTWVQNAAGTTDYKWSATNIKTWCSASPTLVTPNLGTPSAGTLTNCSGLPVTGLASGTSANLASVISDETGSGALVFATSPTLVTPALGTPASGDLSNCTGSATGLTAKQPTRTSTVISAAASTSVSIPSGCKRVVITSEALTMSTSAANFNVQLYNTGDTVQTTVGFSQWLATGSTLAVSNTASGGTSFAAIGTLSNTDRQFHAELMLPRDSGVETTFKAHVQGEASGTDQIQARFGVADSATDDDTIRILVSSGTLSGTVHFDWYYH